MYIKWLHRWCGMDWGNKENGSTLCTALESKWQTTFGLMICSVLVNVGGANGSIQIDSWSTFPKKGASRCSTASLKGTRSLKQHKSSFINYPTNKKIMKKTPSSSIYTFDLQSRHAIVDKLIMKDDYRSFTNEIIRYRRSCLYTNKICNITSNKYWLSEILQG